jgi:hypothetical protein
MIGYNYRRNLMVRDIKEWVHVKMKEDTVMKEAYYGGTTSKEKCHIFRLITDDNKEAMQVETWHTNKTTRCYAMREVLTNKPVEVL